MTKEEMCEYKKIYETYRSRLKPNRKTGREIDEYFTSKYNPCVMDSYEFRETIREKILTNDHEREKLNGVPTTEIVAYLLEESVFVGIDLITGYFHVEGKDKDKMKSIHDDLFVFRGLDKRDLENYFLVAKYVLLKGDELD